MEAEAALAGSTCVSLCPAEASEIMKSIGEAIQYLHSINIAHRDVKVLPAYAPRAVRMAQQSPLAPRLSASLV